MAQIEVKKTEVNVGLQINIDNDVAAVEINDTINLICNCSKAVIILLRFSYSFFSVCFRSTSHYVSLSVLLSGYSLTIYQSVAVGRQLLQHQATSL